MMIRNVALRDFKVFRQLVVCVHQDAWTKFVSGSCGFPLCPCKLLVSIYVAFFWENENTGIMGKLSAKTAAKSYWKIELEDELDDLHLHQEWTSCKVNEGQQHTGSEDDAMEFVESKHSEQLYNHNCSKKCQDKGLFLLVHVARTFMNLQI